MLDFSCVFINVLIKLVLVFVAIELASVFVIMGLIVLVTYFISKNDDGK